MRLPTKPVEKLTISDLKLYPVWRYVNDDSIGETAVRPVARVPVVRLDNTVVGTQVQLASNRLAWATLCNIDAKSPISTEHFLTLSVARGRQWFTLARYHDVDFADSGPEALARFLKFDLDDVFPIRYDIRHLALGDPQALTGLVLKAPRTRLTDAELASLAVD